jgi:rhomboid protease GluP
VALTIDMPNHSQIIPIQNKDLKQLLYICIRALENLEWEISAVTDNTIVALTKQTWGRYSNEVTIECEDYKITVTSKMIHGEIADLGGRTKKDVFAFVSAFETIRYDTVESEVVNNKINTFQQQTVQQTALLEQEIGEIDKVMKLSSGNMNLTWLIMAANVVIFILMAIEGAGLIDVYPMVHVKWGSNFSLLTLTGDWWRLFTSTYIHFGIIHLAMNMYALYMAGVYLEPMLGKTRYITAYTACGILASVASLWWHTDGINSAGASGAIFGLYGLFLALLLTNLIPRKIRLSLLQTTAIFVGYNLVYGMKGNIDNAAHIGGLVSGFVIGLLYAWTIREEQKERRAGWAGPLVLILAVVIAYFYIQKNSLLRAPAAPEEMVEKERTSYPDDNIYNEKYYQFMQMNGRAMMLYNYRDLSNKQIKDTIKKVSSPYLDSAAKYLDEMKEMRVSANTQQRSTLLQKYLDERKKEMAIMLRIIDKGQTGSLWQELEDTRTRAKEFFETAVNLPSY